MLDYPRVYGFFKNGTTRTSMTPKMQRLPGAVSVNGAGRLRLMTGIGCSLMNAGSPNGNFADSDDSGFRHMFTNPDQLVTIIPASS